MVTTALGSLASWLLFALALLAFGTNVFSLTDAIRQRPEAFQAAGKLTKQLWLIITGVATAIGFVFAYQQFAAGGMYVFSFPNIIAFVASAVYLADVRPAVRRMTGGRGGTRGPYGGW